jgi:hypothetical protein
MNRLSLFRFGAAFGIAFGAALLVAGALAWVTGMGVPFVLTIGSLFRGYGAGPFAAVVGGVWGGVTGFAFGAGLAWIYNRLPA